MAKVCEICGKRPERGNVVSHSGRRSHRVRFPNLQRVRVFHEGRRKVMRVCTRCLKAGKVQKA
ncbi:TPA: 50S ribosomal protein L28 [Candidatus Acetothermia bacterium]|nr:50S ribosomal protein L28 [Candidatus Bipolaricaulota bacterium]HAF70019.1 50S ribosomal protein L28 [Candidatus Acetothermia bacterium]